MGSPIEHVRCVFLSSSENTHAFAISLTEMTIKQLGVALFEAYGIDPNGT